MLSLEQKQIENWSGGIRFTPEHIRKPSTIEEVIDVVNEATSSNKRVRVIGSGHSFTPLMATNHLLVSLDYLQGVRTIDEDQFLAEVWGGTKLYQLSEELHERGYALENLGDINAQSISGALLTGTHGTGIGHGILATQLEALTVVLASGEVVTYTKQEDPDHFAAFALSLGMLGIVVSMQIRIIKEQNFVYESKRMDQANVLSNIQSLVQKNEHFECFAFPYSTKTQVKTMNRTEKSAQSLSYKKWKTNTIENKAFSILSEVSRKIPTLSSSISRFSANSVPTSTMIGPSYQLFSTERSVRFHEMEYSIPLKYFSTVLTELNQMIEAKQIAVHFPIECRFVKRDDLWLSPAYKRDAAYIAVHMYKGMPFESYFQAAEEIFQRYDGRPHWGKMHTCTYDQLLKTYPMLPSFLQLRKELDPHDIFVNDYIQRLFAL
ncbi:D-arabinono-1,4-lactone oxidase [Pontibacillus litoralis]|uniref:FAD-binding oxidoreductase n=1 Tax=Pontibacillus litoralis JSM 072002 TaxID=1385512 RepID=A0A0A5HTT9_9BACI|nr:D-arabinono-1,4-lactone oxidase [Pontibacillus litoralis]KGX87007.1 FAD-binding oxidoreductase [Pontibacillus litoralis JSM 072002]